MVFEKGVAGMNAAVEERMRHGEERSDAAI